MDAFNSFDDALCGSCNSPESIMEFIARDVIGNDLVIRTPYGSHRMVYADHTASGRAMHSIESIIQNYVLPLYGNTHTNASTVGRNMNLLRDQARQLIKHCCHAGEDDVLIFTGSGATGAITSFIEMLQLKVPPNLRKQILDGVNPLKRPAVIVGPYEHHSNEISWRESLAEVYRLPETECGEIDLDTLRCMLARLCPYRPVIVTLSACSNVTGLLSDVAKISHLVRDCFGAVLCFDYAARAPYDEIDMRLADAVFISPHKFVGGPGTPGILLMKKKCITATVPHRPGGGTVRYVSEFAIEYEKDIEAREEGGTPEIVGAVRAALAFCLKHKVGIKAIHEKEAFWFEKVRENWICDPCNILVLGPTLLQRLPVISFCIAVPQCKTPRALYLHHHLIVKILNDVFGIQSRGGCQCAGPYAHRLLGIEPVMSETIRKISMEYGCIKPGWCRLNFSYFLSPVEAEYIIRAVKLVALHGWRLLNHYYLDETTGHWHHKERDHCRTTVEMPDPTDACASHPRSCNPLECDLNRQLCEGEQILCCSEPCYPQAVLRLSCAAHTARWFVHESDIL